MNLHFYFVSPKGIGGSFNSLETYSNEESYSETQNIIRWKHEHLKMQVLLLRTEKHCQQTLVKIETTWFQRWYRILQVDWSGIRLYDFKNRYMDTWYMINIENTWYMKTTWKTNAGKYIIQSFCYTASFLGSYGTYGSVLNTIGRKNPLILSSISMSNRVELVRPTSCRNLPSFCAMKLSCWSTCAMDEKIEICVSCMPCIEKCKWFYDI